MMLTCREGVQKEATSETNTPKVMMCGYRKERRRAVGRRGKKKSCREKMKREFSLEALLLLQPVLAVRGPDWTLTSASSMRKWLDRLITRRAAAEYWETEAEGREVNVPFELVFVFGTSGHRRTNSLRLSTDDQAACLCVGLNRTYPLSQRARKSGLILCLRTVLSWEKRPPQSH